MQKALGMRPLLVASLILACDLALVHTTFQGHCLPAICCGILVTIYYLSPDVQTGTLKSASGSGSVKHMPPWTAPCALSGLPTRRNRSDGLQNTAFATTQCLHQLSCSGMSGAAYMSICS